MIWLSHFTLLILGSLNWEEGRRTWGPSSCWWTTSPSCSWYGSATGMHALLHTSAGQNRVCTGHMHRLLGGQQFFLHMAVKRKGGVEALSVFPLSPFDCWYQGTEVLGQPWPVTRSVMLKQPHLHCPRWQPWTTVAGYWTLKIRLVQMRTGFTFYLFSFINM